MSAMTFHPDNHSLTEQEELRYVRTSEARRRDNTAVPAVMFLDEAPLWSGGQIMLRNYLAFAQGVRRVLVRPVSAPETPQALPADASYRVAFPAWPRHLSRFSVQLRMLPAALRAAYAVGRIVRRERVRLVLVNSFYGLLPAFFVRRLLGVPIAWIVHNADIPRNRATRRVLWSVDFLVGCCRSVLLPLNDLPAVERFVVHYGISPPDTAGGDGAALRRLRGWEGHWLAGFAGRLVPEKNLAGLIRGICLARLRSRQPLGLVIAGDGQDRAALERLTAELGCAEAVAFTGYLPAPWRTLAFLDAFCLPSSSLEAMPLAVLEAQLLGIPVAATDVGGTREVVRTGETGLLMLNGRPETIAETILALQAISRTHPTVQAARRMVLEEYSPARQQLMFQQALARILETALSVNSPAT